MPLSDFYLISSLPSDGKLKNDFGPMKTKACFTSLLHQNGNQRNVNVGLPSAI